MEKALHRYLAYDFGPQTGRTTASYGQYGHTKGSHPSPANSQLAYVPFCVISDTQATVRSPARPVRSRVNMAMNQWPAQSQCRVYFGIIRLISMVLRMASLPDNKAPGLTRTTTQLVMKCNSLPEQRHSQVCRGREICACTVVRHISHGVWIHQVFDLRTSETRYLVYESWH